MYTNKGARRCVLPCLCLALVSCEEDRPPEDGSAFGALVTAIGGEEALRSLRSLELEASGRTYVSDQGINVGGQFPLSSTFSHRLSVRPEESLLRNDYIRESRIPFPGQTDYAEIMRGNLGYLTGKYLSLQPVSGPVPMTPDRRSSVVRVQEMMTPHLFVKRFLDRGDRVAVSEATREEIIYVALQFETEGPNIEVLLDPASDLPAFVRTRENHFLRGDVTVEVALAAWVQAPGSRLRLPSSVTMSMDGQSLHEGARTGWRVNQDLSPERFEFPSGPTPPFDEADALRGLNNAHFHYEVSTKGVDFFDGRRDQIEVKKQAEGVYAVGLDEYYSYVIERATDVVVFDPSLYPARANAILDWIESTFPSKSVRRVILSHFHKDHSGALRTYVRKGADVVVSARARPFFAEYLARSAMIGFGITEGELQPTFLSVDDGERLALDDPLRPMVVHQVAVPHSDDTLIVYLKNENITLFADMYASWQGDSQSAILTILNDLGLEASRVGIIHGGGDLFAPGAFGTGPPGGGPPGDNGG